MRRSAVLPTIVATALLMVPASPAAAWDPDETAAVPFEPAPFVLPEAGPFEPSRPVPVPPGIYLVTDAYAGDYVVRDGSVTTYGTSTVHGPTDTYARVIDTVATGTGSTFDGTAFNGRAALTDGRAVAGTYYENFFGTDNGFVSFGIVFFQDDAETAREAATTPRVVAPATVPQAPSGAPAAPSVPSVWTPATGPVGTVVPQVEAPRPRPVVAPDPLPTIRVEVLRGRRVAIWLTALPVGAAWRFQGGEATVLGARDGTASDPFVARWDRLAAPGAAWILRFAVTTAAGPRSLAVEVVVRSPGLIE